MASSKKKSSTKTKTTHAAKLSKATKSEVPAPEIVKEVVAEAKHAVATQSKAPKFARLQRWNKWLAIIHAFQGLAILVLSATQLFPVTTAFLTANPLAEASSVAASQHLFDVDAAWAVAAFFFMAAIAHALMASVYRSRYEREVKQGVNYLRWAEYALSSGVMVMLIGLLSGVQDASLLFALFLLTAAMNVLFLVVEILGNRTSTVTKPLYWLGCALGLVPWLILGTYAVGASVLGDGGLPGYVYGIYGSIFILWAAFAATVLAHLQGKGKWADHLYAEQTFMLLSAVLKTLLAWQIFMGILQP